MKIDITEAEILADLAWPGPPPGEWSVPAQPLGLVPDRKDDDAPEAGLASYATVRTRKWVEVRK